MINSIPEWLVALPFVLSLVLFGMPHGAADGALGLQWAQKRSRPMLRLFMLFSAYSVIIVLTGIWLVALPELGLLLFLLIAAAHFGFSASRLYNWDGVCTGIATGAVVVCLPFAFHFEATRDVFTAASGMMGGGDFPPSFALVAASIGVTGGVIALSLHGYHFVSGSSERGALDGQRKPGATGASIVLAMVVVHALLPPLMSVGMVFLAWHALPETVSIGRRLGERRGVCRMIMRTHFASLAFLVPTLLAMLGLAVLFEMQVSMTAIAVAAIAAYAVLTPGHFAFQELVVWRRTKPIADS